MSRWAAGTWLGALLLAGPACAQSGSATIDLGLGAAFASSLVVTGAVERAAPSGGDIRLPSDLRVVATCHTFNYESGSINLSGQFNFTFTPNRTVITAGTTCSIEAKAFGFESTVVRFPARSTSGTVNVGTLTIQPDSSNHNQVLVKRRNPSTISATSLKAPPNAVKLFDHGMRQLQQNKFANGMKDFEDAIRAYPDYAEAWLGLGRARVRMETLVTAREALLRAAEIDPQLVGPSEELGLLAARQNDLVSAARYLDEALRLDPAHSFQACYSDAVVNLMLKHYDVAERAARAALNFGETGAQSRANYILGMTLLAKGQNAGAKQYLTRYLELVPNAPEHDQIVKELTRIDQLALNQ